MSIAAQLAEGMTALGMALPAETQDRLLQYLALLQKWNSTYNLTAVRNPEKMVSHHLLDSLAVVPHVGEGPLLDVGSGAGLPGIPLAVARPRLAVTLIDAVQKKAAFLQQARFELELANVEVVCERVERWTPAQRFTTVVSRALCEIGEFIALAARLVAPGGLLAAMKGVYPHEELARLPAGWRVRGVPRLDVPGLEAPRHLVLLERD